MSRQTERALLGVLGLAAAFLALTVGVRLLTGSSDDTASDQVSTDAAESVDVATNPVTSTTVLTSLNSVPDGSIDLILPTFPELDDDLDDVTTTTVAATTTTVAKPSVTTTTTTATATSALLVGSTTLATSSTVVDETSSSATSLPDSPSTTVADDTASSSVPAVSSPATTVAPTTTTTGATTTTTAAVTTTIATSVGLTDLEREIARLTNALRADPGGDLKRNGPMPTCVTDEFYQITIDPGTGHPESVPGLKLVESVSRQMSRDWAQKMAAVNTMSHRSTDSQQAIYAALGISWSAYGENVAWAAGYPEAAIARQFFTGWRESSTGHYCSMLAGRFTHFGVGHHRTSDGKDWGAQNFYTLR